MAEVAVQPPGALPRIQPRATLLDLLDRVLAKGVVAYGDIVLSIADLDLVYLNLRAVLSSIGTLEQTTASAGQSHLETVEKPYSRRPREACPPIPTLEGRPRRAESGSGDPGSSTGQAPLPYPQPPPHPHPLPLSGGEGSDTGFRFVPSPLRGRGEGEGGQDPRRRSSAYSPIQPQRVPSLGLKPVERLEFDPKKTQQGLAKLALTLIHLLQKLMERQAIRRMEAGTLTVEQVEQVGQAFQRLDEQMEDLRKQFGLTEKDLNLDLGPLGELA